MRNWNQDTLKETILDAKLSLACRKKIQLKINRRARSCDTLTGPLLAGCSILQLGYVLKITCKIFFNLQIQISKFTLL